MRWMAWATACVVFHAAIARAETSANFSVPAATGDSWPVSSSAQQGLDPQRICSIGPGIAELTEDCVELLAVDCAPWYSGP